MTANATAQPLAECDCCEAGEYYRAENAPARSPCFNCGHQRREHAVPGEHQ